MARWMLAAVPVGLLTGTLVAWFLLALDAVIALHWQYDWLLLGLPVAGVIIALLYHTYGASASGGHSQLIHACYTKDKDALPLRITPLIFFATILTHLCGGSAGREGTAVQMGGSLAAWTGRKLHCHTDDMPVYVVMGMAAGFAAVFGTAFAGTVFALEVLRFRNTSWLWVFPAFMVSVIADKICMSWGAWHTDYPVITAPLTDIVLMGGIVIFGIACGGVARFFAASCRVVKAVCREYITPYWAAPLLGGLVVIAFALIFNTRDYLTLGVYPMPEGGNAIVTAFEQGGAATGGWLMKTLFTAITLGSGFKGGEVTPLFYVGSAFGNMVATYSGFPVGLFAATGFLAVFAGATKTPIASTIMGIELFGLNALPYYALACLMAHICSGRKGIILPEEP